MISVNRNVPQRAQKSKGGGGGSPAPAPLICEYTATVGLDVFRNGTTSINSLTVASGGYNSLVYYISETKLATALGYDSGDTAMSQKYRKASKFAISDICVHPLYAEKNGMRITDVSWYLGWNGIGVQQSIPVVRIDVTFFNPTRYDLTITPPSSMFDNAICIHTHYATTDTTKQHLLPKVAASVEHDCVDYSISNLLYP